MQNDIEIRAVGPDGVAVERTAEQILYCTCDGSFELDETGKPKFQYNGSTDVNWDAQDQMRNQQGERLYLDDNGKAVPESQLKWEGRCPHCMDWFPLEKREDGTLVLFDACKACFEEHLREAEGDSEEV